MGYLQKEVVLVLRGFELKVGQSCPVLKPRLIAVIYHITIIIVSSSGLTMKTGHWVKIPTFLMFAQEYHRTLLDCQKQLGNIMLPSSDISSFQFSLYSHHNLIIFSSYSHHIIIKFLSYCHNILYGWLGTFTSWCLLPQYNCWPRCRPVRGEVQREVTEDAQSGGWGRDRSMWSMNTYT